ILVGAERLAVGLAALAQQALDVGGGVLVEPELPRVGAALLDYRGGLAPDQLRAAGAEAAVAAVGQLVGPAVRGAVAALHRLDAERVAGPQRADVDGPEEGAEVAAEAQVEAQPAALGFDVLDGAELEIAGHGGSLAEAGQRNDLGAGERRGTGFVLAGAAAF